jgi:integrase
MLMAVARHEVLSNPNHGSGDPDELVFNAPLGGPVRQNNFRCRVWLPALDRLEGIVPSDLTPHHLRHTCASLLIQRGATVKEVQTQLGHSTPTVTLNTYTHLFGDDLDALWEPRQSPASPGQVPEVVNLDAKRAERYP